MTNAMVCAWPGTNSSPAFGNRIFVPAFQPGFMLTSSTFSAG